jgi:hypothetical protein
MISSCRIQSFKGFDDLAVEGMRRIVLVGGRNNVGKTAFLEALWMALDRLNPASILHHYARRGMPSLPADLGAVSSPLFHDFDLRRPVEVAITLASGASEKFRLSFDPRHRSRPVAGGSNGGARSISTEGAVGPSGALRLEVVTKGKKRQAAWLTFSGTGPELFIESMSSPVCGAQFFGALHAYSKQEEAQRFSQFDVEGRLDAFVSVLQQVEPRLGGLSLAQVGDTPVIHADVGLARKIPVPLLGSGFGRLLSISLACGASRGGVVFVDEIETGLHYATHEGVWKGLAALATRFDCQIIATTHSYEFIEAGRTALAGQGELFSYVRLGRSQEGVRAHVFAPEDLEAAVEIDLEIR